MQTRSAFRMEIPPVSGYAPDAFTGALLSSQTFIFTSAPASAWIVKPSSPVKTVNRAYSPVFSVIVHSVLSAWLSI